MIGKEFSKTLQEASKKLNEVIMLDEETYTLNEIMPATTYFTYEEEGKTYKLKMSIDCLSVTEE